MVPPRTSTSIWSPATTPMARARSTPTRRIRAWRCLT